MRHNLSLNQCFAKAGRAENGKGNYWTIHPSNLEDFRYPSYPEQGGWFLLTFPGVLSLLLFPNSPCDHAQQRTCVYSCLKSIFRKGDFRRRLTRRTRRKYFSINGVTCLNPLLSSMSLLKQRVCTVIFDRI